MDDELGVVERPTAISDSPSAISHRPLTAGHSLARVLTLSMIARLIHDTTIRMVYPFLPEIAAGLRVSQADVSVMLPLRSGVGIISPLFGLLSDRIGHRRSMVVGLIVLALGLGITGMADGLWLSAIGFIIAGTGTAIYIPALQAYVSDGVPYARRGRALGAIELTWALAGMLGVRVVSAVIDSYSWRAPFLGLAAAALACAALTLLLREPTPSTRAAPIRLAALPFSRSAIALLLVWMLVFLAFENIQVGYAGWFERQFGLTTTQRGEAQTMFGLFELAASGGSSAFLDRIGKKRGVTGGLIAALLGYVMLVTLGPGDVRLALASMGVAFLGFEFSVVSCIPIMSEQMPQARGTMLALGVMTSGLGRMFGAVTGGAFTAGAGFPIAALASGAMAVVTLALFVWGVREHG